MPGFYIPAWDEVDETGVSVCPAGRQDCTVTKINAEESRSGRDMMVCEYTVDNGEAAGETLTGYFVFGLNKNVGEKKLKRMLKAANQPWDQRPTLKEFVAQFPEGKMRISVLVEHQHSIQKGEDWENVPKGVFDSYEGKKNIRAVVSDDWDNDYKPAEKPPSLDLSGMKNGQSSGDGAATDEENVGFGESEKAPF